MWIVGHRHRRRRGRRRRRFVASSALLLFSFDYERFRLDNKKRVVPMGGMKMGTVHGWMSHFTTHISFVSFETH